MPNVTPLRPGDPRRVGRYRLTGRLDDFAGGDVPQRDVFLAQRVDGATVMAAFLGTARAGDAADRDRFVAEARVAGNIPPFCVARILDAGVEDSRPYLITEYIPGPALEGVVAAEGPLPGAAVRGLAIGCATGIASIHQAGLVHGQFGPDLVVLGRDGPRVMHFSTTPPYGAATPAADILAWAHTIVFAAAGHWLASADDLGALPAELRPVVQGCLSPDPVARPHARALLAELLSGADLSAGLLAEGTRRARAAGRAPIPAPAPAGQPSRRGRSRAVAWGAACAGCVLAIVAAVVFITGHHPGAGTPAPTPDAAPSGPVATAGLPIPQQVSGTWTGTVHQRNPVLNVAVRLSLPGGSEHGTLSYPQLGCTGRLGLTSARHALLTFRLKITSGRNNCAPGVVQLALHPGGTMTFTFMRPGGSSPAGTLTRRR
jgi:eukaryotic-like serine/threonine-protein kinase